MPKIDIKELDLAAYEAFIRDKDYHPLQGPGLYRRMKNRGDDVRIFGGYEEDQLRIAAIVRMIPALKILQWGYSPYGYVSDAPEDVHLAAAFYEALAREFRHSRVLYFQFESLAEHQRRDLDGHVCIPAEAGENFRQQFLDCGFRSQPLEVDGLKTDRQTRWVSVLDLVEYPEGKPYTRLGTLSKEAEEENWKYYTPEELLAKMDPKTRGNIMYTTRPYFLIRDLEPEEYGIMAYMNQKAAQKHNFLSSSEKIFHEIAQAYGEDCQVKAVFLDPDAMARNAEKQMSRAQEEIKAIQKELDQNPRLKKKQRRLRDLNQEYAKYESEWEESQQLMAKYGSQPIPLCAALFLLSPTETVYLYSGSDYDLQKYKGATALQWHMINQALERKHLRYNFLGISGYFEPDEPGYGVFFFKRGFGGVPVEYCGVFQYPVHSRMHKAYQNYCQKKL